MMKLPREDKLQLAAKLQEYFREQDWEEIGNLEAEAFLDYMIKEVTPYIYNMGIKDARQLVLERMQGVEEDLYTLEKPIRR
ncbi:DUF2164 domain-containing protein [Ectobacillus panaciterrae]|uniref:DUF2164 domain-containing protein n=1 Tax=Ectobacillus panaciterrae TaxID=363872 RepID=UPI0003FDCCE6|nr:DUF2164 domain-containing protein [Ectobacillus panaciterrae]